MNISGALAQLDSPISAAGELRNQLETHYFAQLAGVSGEEGEEDTQPPTTLSWYPDRLAWQLVVRCVALRSCRSYFITEVPVPRLSSPFQASRKVLRKEQPYRRLHDLLVSQTDQGNISRQEAVSMIPALLLDVQPNHRVCMSAG